MVRLGNVVAEQTYTTAPGDRVPDGAPSIDVHYMTVVLAPGADRAEFAAALTEALADGRGAHRDLDAATFALGPSYIDLGAWIGSQGIALRLIGLGALHGLWTPVTPATLGIDGETASLVAGGGGVMVGPCNPATFADAKPPTREDAHGG